MKQTALGLRQGPLWGMAKNTARVFALLALANLYRVRHRLLQQGA